MDEYLNYTEGLEYIHGRMQTKNGVEVLVPVEEDFYEIKDAIELSIEERLAVDAAQAKLKPERVIVGRDAQFADRGAEIAELKHQLATGIRAMRVTIDEYLEYMGSVPVRNHAR